VPAAAVIPAPIAYTKVVAVKKLVVGFLAVDAGSAPRGVLFTRFRLQPFSRRARLALSCRAAGSSSFTVSKIECSKQAFIRR
jgi:hypothetical protein